MRVSLGLRVVRFFILAVFCAGIWLGISLDFSYVSLAAGASFGILGAALLFRIFYRESHLERTDILPRIDLVLLYALLLIVQSYRAVPQIIRAVVTGRAEPGVLRLRTGLRTETGKTALANTISLIPGTLSLWTDRDHIYVHTLNLETTHTKKAGREIKGQFEPLLARIFG